MRNIQNINIRYGSGVPVPCDPMVHFLKRGRKLMNAGELKEPRLGMFKELLLLCEKYKHLNQYK